MLNSATIMGRLTADPVLRVAVSGNEICRFTVAVDRPTGDRVADFIHVISFGRSATFVEKHFKKGSMIAVQGRIQTGSYTDNKGNKRNSFEVVVNEVSFCGEKPSQSQAATETAVAQNKMPAVNEGLNGYYSNASMSDFEEIVGDEDYE